MAVNDMITGIIGVIIGVILLTALAVTVTTNTDTSTANASLENVSADASALYGLYDLVWAAGGLLLIVFGLFTVVRRK